MLLRRALIGFLLAFATHVGAAAAAPAPYYVAPAALEARFDQHGITVVVVGIRNRFAVHEASCTGKGLPRGNLPAKLYDMFACRLVVSGEKSPEKIYVQTYRSGAAWAFRWGREPFDGIWLG